MKEVEIKNIVGLVKTTNKYVLLFKSDFKSELVAVPLDNSLNEVEASFNQSVSSCRVANDTTVVLVFDESESLAVIGKSEILIYDAEKIGTVK